MSVKETLNRAGTVVGTVLKDKVFWFCMIAAAAVLAIGTKSSFLYPLNDWVDSNCFYTMGKAMVHGKVLYRDLYEQKGPLLYMIHAIGYLISPGSFTGVYLVESVCAGLFLYSAHRILKPYCGWASIAVLPILGALVYSAPSLSYGDSAEEFCVPMYALCMMVSFLSLREDRSVSKWGCFLAGAMGACVLWIKYTMLGFCVGWFIVPAVIVLFKRQWKKFFEMILWVLLGVFAASLPILIYFTVHGALGDLYQVYFYDNMTLYADVEISETQTSWEKLQSIFNEAYNSTRLTFKRNVQYSRLTILGAIWILLFEKWKVKFHLIVTFLLTCLTVYGGGRGYIYYGFILAAFSMFGFIPICRFLELITGLCKKYLPKLEFSKQLRSVFGWFCAAVIVVISVFTTYRLSGNTYMFEYEKEDMPQYQFAEIINEKEDATLLNYGFLDGGFYTTTGIIPNCRFFCYLNIPLDDVMDTQREFIREGKVDFVVTRSYKLNASNYECIAEASMFFDTKVYDYYLHRLIED